MNNDQNSFISSSQPVDIIEGNITSTSNQNELSTLDEPILETIKRDFNAVLRKFGHVLIPRRSLTLLQEWDLWGPLILVTTLAIFLQSNTTKTSSGTHFAEIFTLMLIGSIIVTVTVMKLSEMKSIC
ncbi:unnamed protein product [Rotaria sp. Silwood2]|nr:unnamed protein product [Rotaria sp. Silwood2]CAF4310480.1 unnamed protein product [Rotaria sp. Silwood2]